MIRAIILSLVLVIGLATIVPIATEYAEAGSKRKSKYKKKRYQKRYRGKKRKSVRRKKRVKRYSKRWWQAYRARKKKRQAIARRKRNLRLRQIRLARRNGGAKNRTKYAKSVKRSPSPTKTAVLPTGEKAPANWKNAESTKSEARFDVADGNGSASISVVGPAVGEDSDRPRNEAIGGVPVTSLRRGVIDKMIRENGWVVNDFQKQIGGKTVYVVVAQSEGKRGATQSHIYYFTQVDGRIYNVAASAPKGSSEKIAAESEKVVNSLQRRTTAMNR